MGFSHSLGVALAKLPPGTKFSSAPAAVALLDQVAANRADGFTVDDLVAKVELRRDEQRALRVTPEVSDDVNA